MPTHDSDDSPDYERRHVTLSKEQLEEVAEMAAKKAVEKLEARMYQEIGRGVMKKLSWLVGIAAVSMFLWAQKNGWIKL